MQTLLLDQFVGKDILLKFKLDISQRPLAGKLEAFDVLAAGAQSSTRYYKLLAQAMVMDDEQGRGQRMVVLPHVFAAEDVLWVSEGPVENSIVTPGGNGRRTPAGLEIVG